MCFLKIKSYDPFKILTLLSMTVSTPVPEFGICLWCIAMIQNNIKTWHDASLLVQWVTSLRNCVHSKTFAISSKTTVSPRNVALAHKTFVTSAKLLCFPEKRFVRSQNICDFLISCKTIAFPQKISVHSQNIYIRL